MLSSVPCSVCEGEGSAPLLFGAADPPAILDSPLAERSRSFSFAETVSKHFCSSRGSPQDSASRGEMDVNGERVVGGTANLGIALGRLKSRSAREALEPASPVCSAEPRPFDWAPFYCGHDSKYPIEGLANRRLKWQHLYRTISFSPGPDKRRRSRGAQIP